MKWTSPTLVLALTAGCTLGCALGGCNNAVYYYETEKLSLSLQATPDASAPITGNLGLKQRVVLVVPPTREADNPKQGADGATVQMSALRDNASDETAEALLADAQADRRAAYAKLMHEVPGNALSVISSFRFNKEPAIVDKPTVVKTAVAGDDDATTPGLPTFEVISGVVTIDAAFITGRAARLVASNGLLEAAVEAISPAPQRSRHDIGILRFMHDAVKQVPQGDPEYAHSLLLLSELDGLSTVLGHTYPVATYKDDLSIRNAAGAPIQRTGGFTNVLHYWSEIDASVTALEAAIAQAQDDAARQQFAAPLTAVSIERDRVAAAVRQSPAFTKLVNFWN